MYSVPYIILVLFYTCIYLYEIKPNRTTINVIHIRLTCGIIFISFFGFRGYIGSDWIAYKAFYDNLVTLTIAESQFDILFFLLAKSVNFLGIGYDGFTLTITIIQVYLFDRFLKTQKAVYISLCYIVLIAYFPALIINLLRGFTSILIIIQAIDLLNRGKKIKAVIICCIAIGFHFLTILLIPIIFLFREKYLNKSIILITFIVGLVLYLTQINYLTKPILYISQYLGSHIEYKILSYLASNSIFNSSYGFTLGILEKILCFSLIIYRYNYIISKKIISPIIFNVAIIFICSYFYFNTLYIFIDRISTLFFWGYVLILSSFPIFFQKPVNRFTLSIILLVLCFAKISITFNMQQHDYYNFLFTEHNYEERKKIILEETQQYIDTRMTGEH